MSPQNNIATQAFNQDKRICSANGEKINRPHQVGSSLKVGAEALLWQTPRGLPGSDAVSRAKARYEFHSGRYRLPPEMVDAVGKSTGMHAPLRPKTADNQLNVPRVSETPDAVSHLTRAKIWGPDASYSEGDLVAAPHTWRTGNLQSCMDELVFGHDMDYSHDEAEAMRHGLDEGGDKGGEHSLRNLEEARILTWQVQHFLARARGLGARGLPQITDAFQSASVKGALDEGAFARAAMELGLCKSYHECRCAFKLFSSACAAPSAPQSKALLSVPALVAMIRQPLCANRANIVNGIWQRFDSDASGAVSLGTILDDFNPNQLPQVIYGEMEAAEAVREFVEALGASTMDPRIQRENFALNEAAVRRRPQPVGGPASPIKCAAGKSFAAGQQQACIDGARRSDRDVQKELAARRPEIDRRKQVTLLDFEAYYACISMVTPQDHVFEQIVRAPWVPPMPEEDIVSQRIHGRPRRRHHVPASFPLLAFFQDGTRRMVCLRDDEGLQEIAQGAGGQHCNQMWTWGPNVQKEVLRRLQAQGLHGIAAVRIAP